MRNFLKIQNAVWELIEEKIGSNFAKDLAPIYIFALPVQMFMIMAFGNNGFFHFIGPICYIISIIGGIICFGRRKMFVLGFYFTVQSLLQLSRIYDFVGFMYLVFYIAMAIVFYTLMTKSSKLNYTFPAENGDIMKVCPHCSANIKVEAKYCSSCGKAV